MWRQLLRFHCSKDWVEELKYDRISAFRFTLKKYPILNEIHSIQKFCFYMETTTLNFNIRHIYLLQ